jgi:hypothetical protein
MKRRMCSSSSAFISPGLAPGSFVYGPVSDRFGRRPVLLAGLAAFLVGTALCGAAWSLPALIAQAPGACAGIVLSRAMIRDVYEREAAARGLALVMMAMTLAPAISPALGAYLTEWFGWRAVFAVLGGLGGVVLVATVIRLGETNRQRLQLDPSSMVGANLTLLRSPGFVGFAVCGACTSASWFTFIASAPHILAEALRRPPSTYGLMILLPSGDLHARQCRGGAVRAALRQLAAAARRPGARLCRRARDGAVGRLGRSRRLALVRADRVGRNRRRHERASGHGSGAQHSSAVRRHRVGADELSADGAAALGSFLVALLPYQNAFGMIALYGSFVTLGLAAAVFAVRCTQPPAAAVAEERPVLPSTLAPAPAGDRT